MDIRDKRLMVHHLRRRQLASELPLEQQIRWANRELRIGVTEGRTIMILLAAQWLQELRDRGDGPPGFRS